MGKTSIKIIKKDRLSAIRHLIMVLFTHPYHFPSIMLNHFFFHSISSNDFMKASKLLTSIVPAYFPERASFIAAIVSSFGSEYTASIKVLSTKLFRLLFAFLACSCNICNKSSRKRNEVCFLITASILLLYYIVSQR